MTNRSRITTTFSAPRIRLRALVHNRIAALVAIVSINLLGISAPIVAHATLSQDCSATTPVGTQPCLFGPAPGFEMDGNITQEAPPAVDWGMAAFPYQPLAIFPLVSGTGELDFAGGVKYGDASFTCTTNETSEAKDELTSGEVAIHTFGNQQYGFFRYTRLSGNGDSFVDFVFSKTPPPVTPGFHCPPNRQTGDLVITLTFTNGGAAKAIDIAKWNGSAFASISAGTLGSDWMAANSADGKFGEGGINITKLLFDTSGAFNCHSFGSVYMDSRSSQSTSAQMKDLSESISPPFCQPSSIATASSTNPTNVVAPGTAVSDVATVTGTTGAGAPTGTVQFSLCGPMADASGGCPAGAGALVGSPVTQTSSNALSAPPTATYNSPPTPPTAPTAVGVYCWRAVYTGGSQTNYSGAVPTNFDNECFRVVGQTTTVTTSSPNTASGSQLPGVHATDSATVTLNSGTGGPPTGYVTFKLCVPGQTTCTAIGSPVLLDNTGSATTPVGVSGTTTPNTLASGTYCWQATYAPNSANFAASSDLDKPSTECFTVAKNPTTTHTSVLSQSVDVRSLTATVGDTSSTQVFVPASNSAFVPGQVTFDLYGPSATFNCNADPIFEKVVSPGTYTAGGLLTPPATGVVSASTGTISLSDAHITTTGTYWWVATYAGDNYNVGSRSGCSEEPIQAVDANISIAPLTATNAVGTPHTFTATVNVNNGSGYVTAPNGTHVTFSLTNTGGANAAFVGGVSTCTTTGGSCSVSITSTKAGQTTVKASTTLSVLGVSMTRSTGDGLPGDSVSAVKTWVDASITIGPPSATNVVTHEHVFTITVNAIPSGASPVVFDSVTASVTPTPTTMSTTCANPVLSNGGNTATCTLTINSDVVATYTANATADLDIGGVELTRTTSPDGSQAGPGGSGPAIKHYVAPDSSLVKAEEDLSVPDTTQNGGGFAAGPITAHPLDILEYQLTYTNNGVGAASNVTVTDVVPVAHSAYVAGSCTGGTSCTYDAATHTITWNLGSVNGDGTQKLLTFKIQLSNDFPLGTTTQVTNAAVVTTTEEGSKPSNTVVANVTIPAQQVLAAAITLPKAGIGGPTLPINSVFGGPQSEVATFAAALLMAMICVVAYESLRRLGGEVEETDA
ncbi:MAG TPA: hypothetical protein VNV65_02630 [Candidatus Solibacter sp.]|jgi:hypothetical protein|nr:hypothetical protein [Candidatus Solibacter sp.]